MELVAQMTTEQKKELESRLEAMGKGKGSENIQMEVGGMEISIHPAQIANESDLHSSTLDNSSLSTTVGGLTAAGARTNADVNPVSCGKQTCLRRAAHCTCRNCPLRVSGPSTSTIDVELAAPLSASASKPTMPIIDVKPAAPSGASEPSINSINIK